VGSPGEGTVASSFVFSSYVSPICDALEIIRLGLEGASVPKYLGPSSVPSADSWSLPTARQSALEDLWVQPRPTIP